MQAPLSNPVLLEYDIETLLDRPRPMLSCTTTAWLPHAALSSVGLPALGGSLFSPPLGPTAFDDASAVKQPVLDALLDSTVELATRQQGCLACSD